MLLFKDGKRIEVNGLLLAPSITPSGQMIYQGSHSLEFQGLIFVVRLEFDEVTQLELSGDIAREIPGIVSGKTLSVRCVTQAPEGSVPRNLRALSDD